MILTLKRGSGRIFTGTNWNLAADRNWEVHVMFVPGSPAPKEKYMGNRDIDGIPHCVFQLLDDDFFAQPIEICELPISEDDEEVLYELEAPPPEEKSKTVKVSKSAVQSAKMLMFSGKNWKLTSDRKWKSVSSFAILDVANKVGEKKIGQGTYDIFKTPEGFAASRQGE